MSSSRASSGDRDHPRIRGEHQSLSALDDLLQGIIPAYAGNTTCPVRRLASVLGSSPHTRGTPWTARKPTASARDHPRIRGEHLPGFRRVRYSDGIIPAYAGNTDRYTRPAMVVLGSSPHTRGTRNPNCSRNRRSGDHPRIRGEHSGHNGLPYPGDWIIPAYAGNTIRKAMRVPPRRGSSPHTRGTLRRVPVEYAKRRWIIPAYAGNTMRQPVRSS